MPKLLIADGSPMMHRIMELTFATEGIQVIAVEDGEQALALLPIARPDVVIADHALSGRSGYEIAAFVKEHADLAHVPVLLLASPFEPLDQERADAAGVAGEIAKPFDPGQLVSRVRELLAPKPVVQSRTPAPEAQNGRGPALKLVEPVAPAPRGALDDYFDRLDAALERLDEQFVGHNQLPTPPSTVRARIESDEDPRVPTLDKLLSGAADTSSPDPAVTGRSAVLIEHPLRGAYSLDQDEATLQPVATGTVPETEGGSRRDDLSSLVERLEALRVVSLEPVLEAGVSAPPPPSALVDTAAAPDVSEALIDEVTRRVVQRLAPGAVDAVVTEVVTRVAERLLREEIARLHNTNSPD